MNKQELAAMVAQILSTMDEPPMVKATEYHATAPQPEAKDTGYTDGDFVPDVTQLDLRKLYLTENPENDHASLPGRPRRRPGCGIFPGGRGFRREKRHDGGSDPVP